MRPSAISARTVSAKVHETIRQPRTRFGGAQRGPAPVVTYVLIALNLVMFVLQTVSAQVEDALEMQSPAVADGELWRLLTSAFLHYGPTHILFNMWALYVVGPPLEIGAGSVAIHRALSHECARRICPGVPAVVRRAPPPPVRLPRCSACSARRSWWPGGSTRRPRVICLIVANLVITFLIPNISWQGHIGGLVTGAAIAAAYAYAPRKSRNLIQVGATVAALVLFVGLIWWRTADLLATFAY